MNLYHSPPAESAVPGCDTDTIPPQDIIDIIMSWKINVKYGLGFESLDGLYRPDSVPHAPTLGMLLRLTRGNLASY
jgi:hypothetical protein